MKSTYGKMLSYIVLADKNFRVFKKIGGNLNSFNYFKHSRDCKKIGGCRSISRDKGIETSAFAKSGHHLFSYRKWMMPTTFFLTETT